MGTLVYGSATHGIKLILSLLDYFWLTLNKMNVIIDLKKFTAVLFDLDGTLINSESSVRRSWERWAKRHDIDAELILNESGGRPTKDVVKTFTPKLDADAEAKAIETDEAQDNFDTLLEVGATELLKSIPKKNWAIVTSGSLMLATSRIESTGLPKPRFLITADDVTYGKPHPESYIKAARLLSVPVNKCVVIEDSPAGVKSAKSAGMWVIALKTTHSAADLELADIVVDDLRSIIVKNSHNITNESVSSE